MVAATVGTIVFIIQTLLLIAFVRVVESNLCSISGCVCDMPPLSNATFCSGNFWEWLPPLPYWLKELQITDGRFTALRADSFRGSAVLTKITLRNLSLNYIDPDAFRGLSALELLDLSGNELSWLPSRMLAGSVRLKSLNLQGNLIQNISTVRRALPLTANHNLDNLSLAYNPLRTGLDIDGLPAVIGMDFSGVALESANTSGLRLRHDPEICPDPGWIDCRFIRIRRHRLRKLWLGQTGLSVRMDFLASMYNLTHLDVSGGQIAQGDVLDALYRFEAVQFLNFSGVSIQSPVNSVPRYRSKSSYRPYEEVRSNQKSISTWDIFPPRLRVLDVSRMSLTSLDATTVTKPIKLRKLFADDNRLTTVNFTPSSFFPRLRVLSLTGNHIDSFPTALPESLRRLNLRHNQIRVLPAHALSRLPLLQELNVAENRLTQIQADAFPAVGLNHLTHFSVAHNHLRDLAGGSSWVLPRLQFLDVSYNQLRTLNPDLFFGIPKVAVLDLGGNPWLLRPSHVSQGMECVNQDLLTSFHCYEEFVPKMLELGYLTKLSLRDTGLKALPLGFLSQFSLLNHLDLSENRLESWVFNQWIATGSLPSCLVSLNLSRNGLTDFRNNSFATRSGSCLESLDLSRNPFLCTCQLYPLRQLLPPLAHPSPVQNLPQSQPQPWEGTTNPIVGHGTLATPTKDTNYYCLHPKSSDRRPLLPYLKTLKSCTAERAERARTGVVLRNFVIGAGGVLGLVMCLISCWWRIGGIWGKRLSRNMAYLYRPLSNIPSQLSSPTHL